MLQNVNPILVSFLYMAVIVAVFYMIIIRPQKKRENEVEEMRNNLKVGDEIITIGGIIGKIAKIKGDEIVIEVGADRTKISMKKWAIREIVEPINKVSADKK